MIDTDALLEWEFWENLSDEDRAINTEGVPPYDEMTVADILVEALFGSVSPWGAVLDLGCGTGRLTREIARRAPEATIHAVDISAKMLSRISDVETLTNIVPHLCDGRRLPDDPTFTLLSAAYAVTLFQHIPHQAQVSYFEQVAGWVRPQGRFAFTIATGDTDEFLNHQATPTLLIRWLDESARLRVVDEFTDERGWHWVVTEKRP